MDPLFLIFRCSIIRRFRLLFQWSRRRFSRNSSQKYWTNMDWHDKYLLEHTWRWSQHDTRFRGTASSGLKTIFRTSLTTIQFTTQFQWSPTEAYCSYWRFYWQKTSRKDFVWAFRWNYPQNSWKFQSFVLGIAWIWICWIKIPQDHSRIHDPGWWFREGRWNRWILNLWWSIWRWKLPSTTQFIR